MDKLRAMALAFVFDLLFPNALTELSLERYAAALVIGAQRFDVAEDGEIGPWA